MPIYEYQCGACDHRLELLQKLSDAPATDCPECNKAALRKLVSASAFRLKGGGWYETDFKKDNKKNLAADSGSSGGAGGDDSGGGSAEASKGAKADGGSTKVQGDSKGKSESNSSKPIKPAQQATGS